MNTVAVQTVSKMNMLSYLIGLWNETGPVFAFTDRLKVTVLDPEFEGTKVILVLRYKPEGRGLCPWGPLNL